MTLTSTFRPALIVASGRVAGAAASFLVPLVLVRVLAQDDFGTYKQVFLLFATLFGIAQVGIAESLYYFIPGDPRNAGRYATNALLVLLFAGGVCALALAAGADLVARWMNNPDLAPMLPLLGIFLGLMLATAILEPALTSLGRVASTAAAYAASDFLRAALCLLPLLVVADLRSLLCGAILFGLLRLGGTVLILKRTLAGSGRSPAGGAVFDAALLRRQLAYALPFAAAIVLYAVQENLHQYVVASRVDAAAFAIYAVGCLQVPFVDTFYTSASSVMMVRMTASRADAGQVVAIWRDAARKLALVFFPMAGLFIVSAREVIHLLFTDAYLASAELFRLWVALIALSCVPVDAALRVCADTRFLMALYGLRLGIVALAIHPALTGFGLKGAMLVAILSAAVGKGVGLLRLAGLLGVTVRHVLPWRSLAGLLAATAAAMTAGHYAGRGLDAGPAFVLAARVLAFSAVLGALLAAAGAWRARRLGSPGAALASLPAEPGRS